MLISSRPQFDCKLLEPHLYAYILFYSKSFNSTVRCKYFNRAFIASLSVDNTIRVFKITKKKDANAPAVVLAESDDFPKVHKAEILNVAISSTGKFIMSASKDTTIVIWMLKGEFLINLSCGDGSLTIVAIVNMNQNTKY